MPMSAVNRQAGFTLVEVMTALFITGLAASAVVLMAPGPDSRLRDVAERLAARLHAAGDASVLSNRSVGFVISAEGYLFERQEETSWRAVAADPALSFRAWPANITVRLDDATTPVSKAERVAEFDPLGGATPVRVVLGNGANSWTVTIDDDGGIHASRAR